MSLVQAGLSAQLVLAGLAVAAAFLAPDRSRSRLAGGMAATLGVAGAITGAAAMATTGAARGLQVTIALPLQAPLDPLRPGARRAGWGVPAPGRDRWSQ